MDFDIILSHVEFEHKVDRTKTPYKLICFNVFTLQKGLTSIVFKNSTMRAVAYSGDSLKWASMY